MLNPLKTDYLLLNTRTHSQLAHSASHSKSSFADEVRCGWTFDLAAACGGMLLPRSYFMLRNIIVERAVVCVSQRTTEMTRESAACRPRRRSR